MSGKAKTFYCIICGNVVTDGSQGIECPVCFRWQHRWHPETGISRSEYYAAGRGERVPAVDLWKCKTCSESDQNEGETSNVIDAKQIYLYLGSSYNRGETSKSNTNKKINGNLGSYINEGKIPKLCIVCNNVVTDGSQGLECPDCYRWQHRWHPETGVSRSEYYAAGRGERVPAVDNWKCKTCLGNDYNGDETFKVTKAEICNENLDINQDEDEESKIKKAKNNEGSLENLNNEDETSKIYEAHENNRSLRNSQVKGESSKANEGKSYCQFYKKRLLENHKRTYAAVDTKENNGSLENSQNESKTLQMCILCNNIVTDGSQGLELGERVPAIDSWKCKTCLGRDHNEGEMSKVIKAKKENESVEIRQKKDKPSKIKKTRKSQESSENHQNEGETSKIKVANESNESKESNQIKGEPSKVNETKKSNGQFYKKMLLENHKETYVTCGSQESNESLENTQNTGKTPKICILCKKVVTDGSQGLECPDCYRWQHRWHPETGVSRSEYYAAGRGERVPAVDNWKCKTCLENNKSVGVTSKINGLMENHKETYVDYNTNSITNNETIYQKMRNFLNGTADAKIVNTGLTNWILDPNRSAEEILQLVSKEFQNIPGASRKRDHRAWLVFMVIHNINRIPGLVIEGTWLDVIFCLINYTYDFDFQSAISLFTNSQSTRKQTMQTYSSCFNWVIQVLSSSSLCISPYLQLELIRHIYNKKCFTSLQIQGLMQGVVNIMSDLDPEHLFTVLGENFHCTPEHILFALHFPGIKENEIDRQRNILGNKIQRDLKTSRYTKEIAFVDNTIKYAGLYAQVTAKKYSNDTVNLMKYINQCLSLFMFGSVNPSEFGKLYQSSAYKNPLLLSSTYDGIADITEAIIGVPMTFMMNKDMIDDYEHKYMKTKNAYKKQFNKLLKRRNNLIRALDLPCTTPVLPRMFVLREMHGGNKMYNRRFQKEIYKQKYMEYKI